MANFDVVVVGSCMIDLTCYAPRLPKSGETLCGSNFTIGFGGKGCNQCVAASKLGAKSVLVARIGNDSFGNNYSKKLREYGIGTKYVQVTEGVATGMAQITVADTGENHIVIVLGANEKLTESDVKNVADLIQNSFVLVCQMEIPEMSTVAALQIKATSGKGKSILNAAPATRDMNPLLFALPDIFCVNESEAEIITGMKITDPSSSEKVIQDLIKRGCKEVIITLGEMGAVYGRQGTNKCVYVPTQQVTAVDTTGAGDAFLGALAFYLSSKPDMEMEEMIKRAHRVASLSVQKLGTQESFPSKAEVASGFEN
ncbi:hypothetical protein RUM44_010501 [Polyplax serrata]|uniref:Ribokinase n=1 Tax=Polyplax serrata TaxID=468196 RepID=A0ABR1AVM8_POLSC